MKTNKVEKPNFINVKKNNVGKEFLWFLKQIKNDKNHNYPINTTTLCFIKDMFRQYCIRTGMNYNDLQMKLEIK